MNAVKAPFEPLDVKVATGKVDLVPPHVNRLSDAQAMSGHYQDHGGVSLAIAPFASRFNQPVKLACVRYLMLLRLILLASACRTMLLALQC